VCDKLHGDLPHACQCWCIKALSPATRKRKPSKPYYTRCGLARKEILLHSGGIIDHVSAGPPIRVCVLAEPVVERWEGNGG
jgi:hypothetical protein